MTSPWVQTFTGKMIDFLNPDPEQIDIVDIAHHLAMQARYNGATRKFYSVAEHSVLVYYEVRRYTDRPEIQRRALLHDAAEAYVGDIVKPLKDNLWSDFLVEVEEKLERLIAEKFGVSYPLNSGLVKQADVAVMLAEREMLLERSPREWGSTGDIEPAYQKPWGMSWEQAKHRFLYECWRLKCPGAR